VRKPVITLSCWNIGKYVVRMGGEWNWLRIMFNGVVISSIEPSGTVTREIVN
jgi:hypothetical protein